MTDKHDDNEIDYEDDYVALVDCTCDHDSYDHDWVRCTVVDCECYGHWEE